jgi:hypothetical protein
VQHGSHQNTGRELRCSQIVRSFRFLLDTRRATHKDKSSEFLGNNRGGKEVIFQRKRREDPEEMVRIQTQI